jgi:hypothetical protein
MKVPDFMKWAESMQEEENRLMLVKGTQYLMKISLKTLRALEKEWI